LLSIALIVSIDAHYAKECKCVARARGEHALTTKIS